MIKSENIKNSLKIINNLKQYVIIKYFNEIDFNDEYSIYNCILKHFLNDEIDYLLDFSLFDDMSDIEKENLLNIASDYKFLCLFNNDINNWLYSIEEKTSDYMYIFMTIFDNYDYMLNLLKIGGKDVLELLKSFFFGEFNTSVIEYLRNSFGVDDEVLKKVLIEMAKPNSKYGIFNTLEKSMLCTHPQGTLYLKEQEINVLVDPDTINDKINEVIKEVSFNNISRVDAINKIYEDYISRICAIKTKK